MAAKLEILEIFLVPKNVQGGVVGFYIWTLQEMASLELTNLIQKIILQMRTRIFLFHVV